MTRRRIDVPKALLRPAWNTGGVTISLVIGSWAAGMLIQCLVHNNGPLFWSLFIIISQTSPLLYVFFCTVIWYTSSSSFFGVVTNPFGRSGTNSTCQRVYHYQINHCTSIITIDYRSSWPRVGPKNKKKTLAGSGTNSTRCQFFSLGHITTNDNIRLLFTSQFFFFMFCVLSSDH